MDVTYWVVVLRHRYCAQPGRFQPYYGNPVLNGFRNRFLRATPDFGLLFSVFLPGLRQKPDGGDGFFSIRQRTIIDGLANDLKGNRSYVACRYGTRVKQIR